MLTAIGDVMRRCYDRGWITTRDGNISLRYANSDTLYITPSGWRKTIIHPEHVIRLKFNGHKIEESSGVNPSGELEMHRFLQLNSSSTRAVVHVHPTHVVAAMFSGWDLQELASEFPEVSRYTRVGPTVAKLPATSRELAEETSRSMLDTGGLFTCDIVGQKNHGVCSVGPDPWTAYEHIERLDHICEIALKSGIRPKN